ncbi:unnamed protein product [Rotaria sp. Silwood2]|nr:unnamed protein product [Rotaria sp. Silwood2]CAF3094054.1 unnamed protein product [Rotaria sp. Silwood2]CAF3331815.1 unnamed protein product [Rotaria sp. Silwood2]CAF3405450.1 unnamed protein product [Rotaria sp. Silwood2]
MFSIVQTTKEKRCLLCDEYHYVCDRIRNTKTYWQCERFTGCRGRAIPRDDDEPPVTSPHNHNPNKERNDTEQFKSDLKHRIREGQLPLKQLCRTELIKNYATDPDEESALPQYHQIKNTLYRTENENYPPLPKSINEISLEGKWRMSLDKKDFIVIDHHNPRYLTFGTLQSFENLCSSDFFLDGRLRALAFIPVSEINNLWCEIMGKLHHISRSEDFFNYYTDIWIDEGCLFPRHLCNYYNFSGPQTNNGLEGWHHRLNLNIITFNRNLYVVIDELEKMMHSIKGCPGLLTRSV